MLVDDRGRLWLGTDHGITVLDLQGSAPVAAQGPSPLPAAEVFAVHQDSLGVIWAGTEQGLFSRAGNTWSRQDGIPCDLVLSLALAPDGTFWCGTYRSGLFAVRGRRVNHYDRRTAKLSDTIFSALACDSKGDVWSGTPDGLFHNDGLTWKRFDRTNSGLPSNRIRCVVVDSKDRVLIGTDAGVAQYTPPPSG